MKLKVKILSILTALFALLAGIQFYVGERILLPGYNLIEEKAAWSDMDRVSKALQRELDALYVVTEDHANWLDTYQYMKTVDPAYIKKNFDENTIASLNINAAVMVANDGHIVWSFVSKAGVNESIHIDQMEGEGLLANHPWSALMGTATKHTTGILKTDQGALLAAMAPILDGTGTGQVRGMLIFGRFLDEEELAKLGQWLEVELVGIPLDLQQSITELRHGKLIQERDNTVIRRAIFDVNGHPIETLQIKSPRTITDSGHAVVHSALLFTLVVFLAVMLLMLIMIRKVILVPLQVLKDHALSVGHADINEFKLSLERNDEIGELAREYDQMVLRLSETQKQLVAQSFDAGKAENASGLLHNLGNAITPLSVKVSSIERQLRGSPTGDVELVLEELCREGTHPERKAELIKFLQMVSSELAHVITDTVFELESVNRQIFNIQNILEQQALSSRAPKVMESIAIPELIKLSAEMVPPELSDQIKIDIDHKLHTLGEVRVYRMALQQVFQNLIVNSAEAIKAKKVVNGVVRVRGDVIYRDGKSYIQICFTDNGIGMDQEQLSRFAEKGFSSKESNKNRGIGLHWAVNTINALGGCMYAESDGLNRGARVYVLVPFEPKIDRIVNKLGKVKHA